MSKTLRPSENVDPNTKIAELRVSGGTPVGKLAGGIKKYVYEGYNVSLLAIGAGAVNQAVKAVATARSMCASEAGPSLVVIPGFRNQEIKGITRTAIVLRIVVAKEAGQ